MSILNSFKRGYAEISHSRKLGHSSQRDTFATSMTEAWRRTTSLIAILSLGGIAAHLLLRFGLHTNATVQLIPLWATLAIGGIPLLYELLKKLAQRQFGSDLLAGISIVSAVLLGEYLAGAIVVLMLAGGEALENYAVRNATSVLRALAKRVPSAAHRRRNSQIINIALDEVAVGDTLAVFPHDICPVDGVVVEGHGMMDESFLTGEPFKITKAPGSTVISGAINGESALTITATKRAVDSRYAKIMEVMRDSHAHQSSDARDCTSKRVRRNDLERYRDARRGLRSFDSRCRRAHPGSDRRPCSPQRAACRDPAAGDFRFINFRR